MPLSRICLATAAVALAAPAMAADYNPPIYVDKAPEWVPVEVGSGWYLRGDISYNVGDPIYDFDLFGESTDNRRFGGSVGMGYHFNDYLRADINIGYVGSDRYSIGYGPYSAEASHTVWSGLANAYLDLGTIVGITPYVGAGAGVTYSRHEAELVGPALSADWSDRQYNFAYTLNAGVSYAVTDNVSVDLGYQYLNTPRMEYLDTDTGEIDRGTDYHQVRLGLRYNLW